MARLRIALETIVSTHTENLDIRSIALAGEAAPGAEVDLCAYIQGGSVRE